MTSSASSRYVLVSRRTALSGALGATLLALAGCNDDSSTLPGAAETAGPTSASSAANGSSPSAAASSPAAAGSSVGESGDALPSSATLTVSFTFAAQSSGGPVRNPYIAVWLENEAGELVKTVALWHEQRGARGGGPGGGQDRWLSEMKAFSALGAADADTVSSSTRQPGSYSVAWDGSSVSSGRAEAGTYQLFVEAAREHGPYELVQQKITLGSKGASFDLAPSGELTAASAKYEV